MWRSPLITRVINSGSHLPTRPSFMIWPLIGSKLFSKVATFFYMHITIFKAFLASTGLPTYYLNTLSSGFSSNYHKVVFLLIWKSFRFEKMTAIGWCYNHIVSFDHINDIVGQVNECHNANWCVIYNSHNYYYENPLKEWLSTSKDARVVVANHLRSSMSSRLSKQKLYSTVHILVPCIHKIGTFVQALPKEAVSLPDTNPTNSKPWQWIRDVHESVSYTNTFSSQWETNGWIAMV